MGWESAVLEIVQLLVPHSAPRETAPETVHILLRRRKLSILKQKVGYRQQQSPQVLSNGARGPDPGAMSGELKAAVTIHYAETKLAITNGHVGG